MALQSENPKQVGDFDVGAFQYLLKPIDEQRFAEVFDRTAALRFKDGELEYYEKTGRLEEKLQGQFFQIHKGDPVNFAYVDGDDKTEVTHTNGIRKIEYVAYGSDTMFPICVKAVSECLSDDVSYAYIMAATGAAFRFVWNQEEWDLSNIDIYHTLKESNDIYQYGT